MERIWFLGRHGFGRHYQLSWRRNKYLLLYSVSLRKYVILSFRGCQIFQDKSRIFLKITEFFFFQKFYNNFVHNLMKGSEYFKEKYSRLLFKIHIVQDKIWQHSKITYLQSTITLIRITVITHFKWISYKYPQDHTVIFGTWLSFLNLKKKWFWKSYSVWKISQNVFSYPYIRIKFYNEEPLFLAYSRNSLCTVSFPLQISVSMD